jgi:hypothetical protein
VTPQPKPRKRQNSSRVQKSKKVAPKASPQLTAADIFSLLSKDPEKMVGPVLQWQKLLKERMSID